MAEFSVSTSNKPVSPLPNTCIFCNTAFTVSKPSTTCDTNKLALFNACTERQSDTSRFILENESDILSGKLELNYHRLCISTFCSPLHIQRCKKHKLVSESGHVSDHRTCNASLVVKAAPFLKGHSPLTRTPMTLQCLCILSK